MYQKGDGHVELLTASVRNIDHHLYALKLGSDIITSPLKILKEWGERGLLTPGNDYSYNPKILKAIAYKNMDITKSWQGFDIRHELTEKGQERFAADWNALIK